MYENGAAVLIGSIEGRVSVENLDVSSPEVKRYLFKCHRINETIYPVHAISYRPPSGDRNSVFATGGGDGTVVLWDVNNKKRLHQFPSFDTSCSALDFSKDGLLLAIAVSYAYDQGEIPHPPDHVYLADVNSILS